MPEAGEAEYEIDPKDLSCRYHHASGAGGQNVNKVATAVMVYIPTGIKVEMQEERTQQKNRDSYEDYPCACCGPLCTDCPR